MRGVVAVACEISSELKYITAPWGGGLRGSVKKGIIGLRFGTTV